MAIKGFEKKDPMQQFNQLMQLMNQMDAMGARKEERITNEMTALSNQLKNATNLDSLNNLMPNIESFNNKASKLGYEQYSLAPIVNEKKRLYGNASNSFNSAKMYQDKNEGDPDELYNEIMGMSWKEANSELSDLYSIASNIEEGMKSGFSLKGDNKYTTTSLSKSIEKRIGQIQSKMDVFAENEGKFLIFNPDGTMDEATKGIYDDLQFKILSGDNKDFDKYFDDVVDSVSRNFQIQEKGYNDWLTIYEQSKQTKTLDEMENISEANVEFYKKIMKDDGADSNDDVSPEFAKRMAEVFRTNAEKINYQHEVLTGKLYNDNAIYKNIDLENANNLPGTSNLTNAQKVDSNNKEEFETTKTKLKENTILTKEDKIVETKPYDKKITDTSKFTLDLNQSLSNIVKEGNTFKLYDEESQSYKDIPKENITEIMINGKLQNVPVIRGERKIKRKDGSYSLEKNLITHIYVNGKWKKASIPEKKRRGSKPKDISRITSGPGLGLLDFPEMPSSNFVSQKREEDSQSQFFNFASESLAKQLIK